MHQNTIIVVLLCLTLLISYFSALFYSLTKIPDVIFLLGFGLLMGPGLGLASKEVFADQASLMGLIALSIILFEAGINIDIETLLKHLKKALVLSVFTIFSAIILVGVTINYLFLPDLFTLPQAMLLGAMVGGTSTVAVYGIMADLEKHLKNTTTVKVILMMESIISDPICIISSLILIRMIMQPDRSLLVFTQDLINYLTGQFVFSSGFGLFIGLAWAQVLDRLRRLPYTYVVTIAVLFPLYVLSELLVGEGGGVMAALFFGLGITNYRYIMKKLGIDNKVLVDTDRLRGFHEEVTFFVKSLFFVYIGIIVSPSIRFLFIGFSVVIILIAMRFLLVWRISKRLTFTREEKTVSQLIYASGLPAFIMSQLPAISDPTGEFFLTPEIYPSICMPIVLGTIIFSGLIAPKMAEKELSREQLKEKPKELSTSKPEETPELVTVSDDS